MPPAVAVQCCRDSAASIGVVAGGCRDPAAVQFRDKLDDPLREGGLQPDQFGVAAAQPGRVDADDVLEAADRQVVALLWPRPRATPCGGSARWTRASSWRECSSRSMAATVEPLMSFFSVAAGALWPVSVLVHRCRVSSTCISGRLSRSSARCTLTRPLARAARAAKSGTPGEIRSGRAENRARSESSLRACQFLAERANKGHQSNVTFRPVLRVRRRAATPSITRKSISRKASGSPYRAVEVIQTGATVWLKAMAITASDGNQGQHGDGGSDDQQGPPETQWCHGTNANSPAPAPRLKPSKWAGQDNLEGTDQHGPGSHTLNPHIHADAVTAGRVPRQNEEG